MSRIPKNEPDLFAVLFWRTHLLAGKRSYQLGEITTEYLNLDSQTVRKLSERVDELVPVLHRIMDEPDKSLAVAVQKMLFFCRRFDFNGNAPNWVIDNCVPTGTIISGAGEGTLKAHDFK